MAQMVEEEVQAQTPPTPGRVVGELKIHPFKSTIFGNKRMIRVWLPPGYGDRMNRKRLYPVFYLNDGQNLFDPSTAFGGIEWQVDETAQRLIQERRIEPLIIIGIDNAQADRVREYVPYRAAGIPVRTVAGKKYPEFLQREVIPFVRKRYRIASGPENTGLGGSSLGGLIALYTSMVRPGEFGRLLIESPSLFVGERRILRESLRVKNWPERIFLGVGTKELGDDRAQNQKVVEDVCTLAEILRKSGLSGDRLEVDIDEGASHSESAWAGRFPDALAFLFGK
jgi:predicted alpha/beta superfamily hydrolase